MTNPVQGASRPAAGSASTWPAVLTWRSLHAPRMESVRVQLAGNRIKAAGRIIGGNCDEHPAFSASYDLVTDEVGVTRRLSLRSSVAGGERQCSITRDGEGNWLVENGNTPVRSRYEGALDVDVVLSPFFNALPIRRLSLQVSSDDVQVPVVYVNLPDLAVHAASLTYSSGGDGIQVLSPVSSASVQIDKDGFVVRYPGLAERV